MAPTLITVITPVRNGGAYWEQYCATIQRLNTRPLEIVVVDDHSSDDSAQMIADRLNSLDDVHVVLLDNMGEGVSAARNTGLRYCSTEFVALLDVDDTWTPDRLILASHTLGTTNLQMLHSLPSADRKGTAPTSLASGPCAALGLVRGTHIIGGSCSGAIFHVKSALRLGGFDESLSYAEDFDFWLRYVFAFGASPFAAESVRLGLTGGHQSLPVIARTELDLESRSFILERFVSDLRGAAYMTYFAAAQEHILRLLIAYFGATLRNGRLPKLQCLGCIKVWFPFRSPQQSIFRFLRSFCRAMRGLHSERRYRNA